MIGLLCIGGVCLAYLFGRWTQIGEQEAENRRLSARARELEALLHISQRAAREAVAQAREALRELRELP